MAYTTAMAAAFLAPFITIDIIRRIKGNTGSVGES
jgi:hypothetical protein